MSAFIQNKRVRFPSQRQFPEDVDVSVVSDSLARGFRTVTKQPVISESIGSSVLTLGQLGSRQEGKTHPFPGPSLNSPTAATVWGTKPSTQGPLVHILDFE